MLQATVFACEHEFESYYALAKRSWKILKAATWGLLGMRKAPKQHAMQHVAYL